MTRHYTDGIDVKDRSTYPFGDELPESAREMIYERHREQFWNDAEIIACELGYSGVEAAGRMGGWLVPFAERSGTRLYHSDLMDDGVDYNGEPTVEAERFAELEERLAKLMESQREEFKREIREEVERAEAETIVQVEYAVEVSAFVNTETGEVEKVVVWDETIGQPRSFARGDYSGPVTVETEQKAREIAETTAWPAWQFGG